MVSSISIHALLAALLATPSLSFVIRSFSSPLGLRNPIAAAAGGDGLYLGIDCGTQGTKALVYDAASREVLGVGSVSYGILPTDVPGRAEQDPSTWVGALVDASNAAFDAADAASAVGGSAAPSRSRVRGVGVSGQQHGMVCLDEAFNVIRPAKLWCDTESASEAAELAQALGWGVVAGYTSSKLLWLKRHEPDSYARLRHLALPHDYLNWRLTGGGEVVSECGDASGTGFLDGAARAWDLDAVR